MRVVSDISPISNLAIIDRLHLLRRQFQELWIPDAVEAELRNLPDSSALAKIGLARREGWIRVRTVQANSIVRLLQSDLDRGEAEAIALAIELRADLILLDERDGRIAAERAGLFIAQKLEEQILRIANE